MSSDSRAYFCNSLRKYGWDSFMWEVIDYAETLEELKRKEMYWINYYKSFVGFSDSNGYNLTLGGDGGAGVIWTDERRKNKSKQTREWYKKNGYSDNSKKKQSESMKKHYRENGSKLTGRLGEKCGGSKLTDRERFEIHELANCGLFKLKEIADIYNISMSLVSYYKNHFEKYAQNLLMA